MGEQNSSITRVWPVFLHLIRNDSTGRKWLPTILKAVATSSGNRSGESLPAFQSPLHPELVCRPREPRSINGYAGLYLPPCFERRLPPPEAFLRWLIQEAGKSWQPKMNRIGRDAFRNRERRDLFEGNTAEVERARGKALAELHPFGANRSFRRWWAFEGFTSIDCLLETDDFVLLIEGKRTDVLAPSTRWYPTRTQLARNLEVAQCHASGKQFGVLVIGEKPISISPARIDEGLPHLAPEQREALREHHLGALTWDEVCDKTGLPRSILERDATTAIANLRVAGLL